MKEQRDVYTKNMTYTNELYGEYNRRKKKELKTVVEIFEETCEKNQNRPFLGKIEKNKKAVFETYGEIFKKVEFLSDFLNEITEMNTLVGICGRNSAEWIVCDQAIMRANCVTVPIYTTFGIESLSMIMKETEIGVIFIESENLELLELMDHQIHTIIVMNSVVDMKDDLLVEYEKNKKMKILFLEKIIDEFTKKSVKSDDLKNLELKDLENLENLQSNDLENTEKYPKLTDLASICYTSGTTGNPKGVQITHKNMASVLLGYKIAIESKQQYEMTKTDVYLSFLPLSHIFERLITMALANAGSSIVFFRNKKTLAEDFQIVRPTFVVGVPKVFENIRDGIYKKIPTFMRKIFNYFLNRKNRVTEVSYDPIRLLGEFLVFRKIRRKFGGRIKFFLSGSAPLSEDLHNFMQNVFGCDLLQGYGLTETVASATCAVPTFNKPGTVGIPFPMTKIMLHKHKNGLKEICVKGDNIFSSYYKHKSKKDFYRGYYKTGDFGEFTEDGYIKIIGRQKNSFKTSLAEFIVPEKIELLFSDLFADIFITGKTTESFLVAVVVSEDSKEVVMEKLNSYAGVLKEKKLLFGFQVPKKVFVIKQNFMDLKLLNPTGKVVRKKVEDMFENEINEMYK